MQRYAISKIGPDDVTKKELQVEKGGSFYSNLMFEAWGGEKTAGETEREQPLKQDEKQARMVSEKQEEPFQGENSSVGHC